MDQGDDRDDTHCLSVCNEELYLFYERHGLDFEQVNMTLYRGFLLPLMEQQDDCLKTTTTDDKEKEEVWRQWFQQVSGHLQQLKDTMSGRLDTLERSWERDKVGWEQALSQRLVEHHRYVVEQTQLYLKSAAVDQVRDVNGFTQTMLESSLHRLESSMRTLLPQQETKVAQVIQESVATVFKQQQQQQQQQQQGGNSTTTTPLEELVAMSDKLTQLLDARLKDQFVHLSQQNAQIVAQCNANAQQDERHRVGLASLEHKFQTQTQQWNQQMGDLAEITKRFQNSSTKGAMSEHMLHGLLTSRYPDASIEHVGQKVSSSGDILFRRPNQCQILIENKAHDGSRNVSTDDVVKFERDCKKQQCCGLLVAQHAGIALKEQFHIDIFPETGSVLLYLRKAQYDMDVIGLAIDALERVHAQLQRLAQDSRDTVVLPVSVLERLRGDFREFHDGKKELMKKFKEQYDHNVKMVTSWSFPQLDSYLSSSASSAATSATASTSAIATTSTAKDKCVHCRKSFKDLALHLSKCPRYQEDGVPIAPVAPVDPSPLKRYFSPHSPKRQRRCSEEQEA